MNDKAFERYIHLDNFLTWLNSRHPEYYQQYKKEAQSKGSFNEVENDKD